MKLKTGVDPMSWVSFKNTRGLPFHGMGAFVGIGKTQRAHVFTAASIPVDPEAYKKIDPKKLAGTKSSSSLAKRRASTVSSCAMAGT